MSPRSSRRRSSGRLRVLLVEDEMMIALFMQTMLADLGHDVVGPVARLDKALKLANDEDVDIAILDVNINGGEVYPVAAVLSARGVPFIFATGYGKTGLRPPYGDCPILPKPYRQDDLRAAIARLAADGPPD